MPAGRLHAAPYYHPEINTDRGKPKFTIFRFPGHHSDGVAKIRDEGVLHRPWLCNTTVVQTHYLSPEELSVYLILFESRAMKR
jgi:hypothetical protein